MDLIRLLGQLLAVCTGIGLIIGGVAAIYVPAAAILAGVFVLALGLFLIDDGRGET